MIHWVTTATNPYKVQLGYDCGQKGWRLHAIEADEKATFSGVGKQRSLCGTRPRYGWSLDLFIEDKCEKCQRKLGFVKNPHTRQRERIADEPLDNQHVQVV